MLTLPRPVIVGLPGLELDPEITAALRALNPLGVILFARNVESPDQVRALTQAVRTTLSRTTPILIDQEGGRVARLKGNRFRHPPPAAAFGTLFDLDPQAAVRAAFLNARLIAYELENLGIDVDCAPVADVPAPDGHGVIGDRAFHADPRIVLRLARATLRGLLAGGVQPVMKHIPGHGRARADSHLELPVVDAPAQALGRDLVPFRGLAGMAPWAMTAHVTYTALDADRCATLSPEIIRNTIRRRAGFHGVLITDDLRMKALSGEVAANARAALAAGCDVALDCAPGPDEWTRLGESLPPMRPASWRRLSRARRLAGRLAGRRHLAFDAAAAARELATLLAGARQAS